MKGKTMRVLLFLLVPFLAFGQTLTYVDHKDAGFEILYTAASIDSGEYESVSFASYFGNFNKDLATYDVGYEFELDTLTADTDETEIVGIFIEGKSAIGTWNKVDTLLAADTLNGSHSGFAQFGLTQFNQDDYGSFPEYRVNVIATHADGNAFDCKVALFFRKRD